MKDKHDTAETGIKVLLSYANSILATLREPFLVLDKKLQVISANRVFYTTFKITEKDAIGRHLPDLGNKQWDIPKLLQLLKSIISDNIVVTDYEVGHRFEQIGQRVMRLNARRLRIPAKIAEIISPRVNNGGGGELILLAIEDITERKRLQEGLKESEASYRRVFNTSRDGLFFVHKTNADILNSNESIQELLGYSPDELLQKKLWDIGIVNNVLDFRQTVSILERDGVIHYQDTPVYTHSGMNIPTEAFLINKPNVFQCNIRNITERKETEEALKQSEAKFKAIFNESTDGMLLTDINAQHFLMCNATICHMLGYTTEQLLHMRIDDIHPKRDLPLVIEQCERQAKGEITLAPGLPVKRNDGTIFYADISASPITLAGQRYLMRSFRDITEGKQIQDQLKEKIKDLERFSNFSVDRELKMEQLEIKVKELEAALQAR